MPWSLVNNSSLWPTVQWASKWVKPSIIGELIRVSLLDKNENHPDFRVVLSEYDLAVK